MLGVAVTALIAAFMAGVAANVTVVQHGGHLRPDPVLLREGSRRPAYYLRAGRLVTIGGILISVATAFIAKGYSNIMNYIQTLFSIFNAPLFATFIIAMFWRRATRVGRVLEPRRRHGDARTRSTAWTPTTSIFHFGSALSASFWQAIIAFIVGAVVLVVVSLVTKPKPTEELRGLVWGLTRKEEREVNDDPRDKLWWRSPALLGGVAIAIVIVLNIIFI